MREKCGLCCVLHGYRGLVGPCLCKGTAREPHHVFQSARFADTIRICVICLHHEYRRSPVRAWRSPALVELRLLLTTILTSRPGAVVTFGLVCSSFVSVSRGTTRRHYFLPLGDETAPSVQQGNMLANRIAGAAHLGFISLIEVALEIYVTVRKSKR